MDGAGILWCVFIFSILAFALWGLFRKHGLEPLGLVKINDFVEEKCRQAIIRACKEASIAGLNRTAAQNLLSEIARHAIAREFAAIHPNRPFAVTDSWPGATCIISGNIAVIDPWLGHDFTSDGEGTKPVNVEINRQPALKLTGKPSLKGELDRVFAPPPKQTAPAATAGPAKPAPTPARQVGGKPGPRRAK